MWMHGFKLPYEIWSMYGFGICIIYVGTGQIGICTIQYQTAVMERSVKNQTLVRTTLLFLGMSQLIFYYAT